MSKVTVKQAALLTGMSRETINSATKSGKLSSTKNSRNAKVIDVSELQRVYPLIKTMEDVRSESTFVKPIQETSSSDVRSELMLLQEKFSSLEESKNALIAERNRERGQLESEIENLRGSMQKVQDQHSKALLLITDQSEKHTDGAGGWEKSIQSLEDQIANQKTVFESRVEKLKGEAKEEAIAEIKSQSWWRIAFSGKGSPTRGKISR